MSRSKRAQIVMPVVVIAIAVMILGVLYYQSKQTLASASSTRTSDSTATVYAERRAAGNTQQEAEVLPGLSRVYDKQKDDLVEVSGLVVSVLDREGVPFIITIADGTGTAEVVYFSPPSDIKESISVSKWMSLTARVDSYMGELQLKPVAPELIRIQNLNDLDPSSVNKPRFLESREQMRLGDSVYFDGTLSRVTRSRSGKTVFGSITIQNGQEISYFWNPPPDDIREGLRVSGYAMIGEYRGALQLQPYLPILTAPR
jgi:DNA/RNA endonuclease YhcR with UshA esterase domain